ncbi:MAG: hypothetical protein ACLGHQ_01600, partial [Acidimicrobiia bacterium]
MSATISIRSSSITSSTGSCADAGRRPVTPRRVPAATYRRRRAIVGTLLAVLVAASVVLAHDV